MVLTACGVAGLQSMIAHPVVGVLGEIRECDPLRFPPLLQPRQPLRVVNGPELLPLGS